MLGDAPSESWAAVGLTPGGAFIAVDSFAFEPEFDEDDGEDAPFEQGQLAASGGTMQLDTAIAKMTVRPRFAIGLLIRAYVTEKKANRQEKDREITVVYRTVNHRH